MVHFEPSDEAPVKANLAPVTYLPGAAPGMKRRSPLDVGPVFGFGDDGLDEGISDGGGTGAEADADPAAERARAEKLLLGRLRGRSLSRAEAYSVLNGTDLDENDVEELLVRFEELHYLDEEKLADQIIHSHHERKGLGRTGVEAEMRRRKLASNVILEKLEEIPDDEEERAIELACKRVQQLERYDEQTVDRRLTGFLMRKGYNSSVVRVAVKAALASRGGGNRGGRSTVRFQ
jgi:regulatory protein